MRRYGLRGQWLLIIILALVCFTNCQKEVDSPFNNSGTVVNDAEKVTGGINGIVVDENNDPVEGLTVVSGSATTTTDRYGAFRFRNIQLSKANATVKVTRPGYFNAYRTFPAVGGRIHNVRIKLIPKNNSGSFTGSAGGTVNITGGAKLVVPAAAVTDAAGAAYSGTVNVAMTWIDPSSPELPYTLMGDLRGITTTGEERGLSTYGMLGVELTNATGQPLKIAAGKTAELTFPVPASLQGSAPATIDLWHFDEATARWKQEGTATKTGTNYIANVSHFSFWNCDAPFPLVDLCMSLKDNNNQPLINVQVRIKRVVNGTYGYGRTDSTGSLCGKVPKNEALVLEVLDVCNNVVFSQNIGPFSANTTLPPITVTIPAPNSLIITGTITNCAGANVTNGAAAIYISNGNHYTVPVTNGSFSLGILQCTGATINFTVLGIDYSNLQQSAPVGGSGTSGTVNVGTVQACGTSSAQFIELFIDGVPYNFAAPPDNISHNDTAITGTYSNRSWISGFQQGGGTTSSVTLSFNNNQVPAAGLPINSVGIALAGAGLSSQTITTASPVVNISEYGPPVTGFIVGTFNIQMDFNGNIKTVICNFRVRRN
jgi:hypothetical protein